MVLHTACIYSSCSTLWSGARVRIASCHLLQPLGLGGPLQRSAHNPLVYVGHALHVLLTGVVQEVCARHSEMSDPAMANVDQIILVMSLNLPPFDARQATRFLVSAEAANIPVMLLLNKADLLEEDMTAALVAEVLLVLSLSHFSTQT